MIGRTLTHYEIIEPLGQGGMGEVYRARDTKLGREVALKILHPKTAANPDLLDRFGREARALAALDHPGIVTVYSVEEADGVNFITMQLVDGKPLDEQIPAGGLPVDRVIEIATALAEALAAAHDQGIIHRDLKPANVIVTSEGRVKVLDFGLAKLTDTGSGPTSDLTATADMMTRAGAVLGTMPYMSPEQLAGRAVDQRTDVFSFGVLLYEMATGRRPFVGASSAELTSAILRDSPQPPTACRPGLPAGLDQIVSRCLAKDATVRFPDMRDIATALRNLSADDVKQPTPQHSPARRLPRGPVIAGATIVVLGLLVGLAQQLSLGPFGRDDNGAEGAGIHSIAVLPLDNYSSDPGQDYFAEGMTDAVTADLARISQIRVTSRGSAMQFKGADRPPTPEIARILDVDAIIEGSVLRSGDRVRITAQLIDARADRHLWADSFESRDQDVLALQSDLASAIANAINVQLTPEEETRLVSASSVDPAAYDAYLKGRYFFNRPNDENLQKAISRFEEALAISPDFVPALAGLSDAYLWAGYNEGVITASAAKAKAREAVEKAIRLNAGSGEAQASLATFKLWCEYDWAGSEIGYRRAFTLNPSYAFAHDQFALGLAFQGRFAESIAESRRAMELDPLNPQILIDGVFAEAWQGNHAAARDLVARAADLDPTFFFSEFTYGWIDIQRGEPAAAIPHLQKAKTMGAPAFVSAWLAYSYGAAGDRQRATAEVADLHKMSYEGRITPFDQAVVALGLGENASAVSLLEQAHAADSQWLTWLGQDRIFDPVRSNPRFRDLLQTLGFGD